MQANRRSGLFGLQAAFDPSKHRRDRLGRFTEAENAEISAAGEEASSQVDARGFHSADRYEEMRTAARTEGAKQRQIEIAARHAREKAEDDALRKWKGLGAVIDRSDARIKRAGDRAARLEREAERARMAAEEEADRKLLRVSDPELRKDRDRQIAQAGETAAAEARRRADYPAQVQKALQEAPQMTDEERDAMRAGALMESRGNPNAKNSGSSAAGKYQMTSAYDAVIEKKLGWKRSDWFDPKATGEKKEEMARRQDIIYQTVILPQRRREAADLLKRYPDTGITQPQLIALLGFGKGNVEPLLRSGVDLPQQAAQNGGPKNKPLLEYAQEVNTKLGLPPNPAFEKYIAGLRAKHRK